MNATTDVCRLCDGIVRDMGFDAYHWDPLCENVYAAGFEGNLSSPYAMVTAFEVWEHLANPKDDLNALFALAPRLLMATTSLYTGQGDNWEYLMPLTGRHVFFYSMAALEYIAQKYGYEVDVVKGKYILFYKQAPTPTWHRVLRKMLAHDRSRMLRALFALQRHPCRADRDHRLMVNLVGAETGGNLATR